MTNTHQSIYKRKAQAYNETEHGFFVNVGYAESGKPKSLSKEGFNGYTVRTDSGLFGTGRHDG